MSLKLSATRFNKAREYIMVQGRELEQKLFEYHFEGGSKSAVLEVLKKHQNPDGGFQNTGEGPRDESSPIELALHFSILSSWKYLQMLQWSKTESTT